MKQTRTTERDQMIFVLYFRRQMTAKEVKEAVQSERGWTLTEDQIRHAIRRVREDVPRGADSPESPILPGHKSK